MEPRDTMDTEQTIRADRTDSRGHLDMEQYSNSVVEVLARSLDPHIQEYFEATKGVFSYGYESFHDMVRSVLVQYDMANSESYRIKYSNEIMARKKRRQSWIIRLKENRKKYSFRDPESYFHHLYLQLTNRAGSIQLRDKYGTVDIEKIIDSVMLECEAWKQKHGSLLIDFPNFPYIGRITIPAVFKSDIFVSLVQVINTNYGGNIKHILFQAPTEMIVNPIFSSSHGKAAVKLTADKQMIAELFHDENYKIQFFDIPEEAKKEFDVSGRTKIPVLDDVDMSIISFLINNAMFDLTSSSMLTPMQSCSLNQLCSAALGVSNKSIGAGQRDAIRKRLLRLNYPISAIGDKGTIFSWSVLSSVAIHKAEEDSGTGVTVVDYTLGPVLTRSLIEGRLLSLPSMEMRALKTAAGRTLIVQLQLDRLTCGWNNRHTQRYKYSRFCQIMLLRSRTVSKNMAIITAALEDIQKNAKGSVIKRYRIEGGEIEIEFYPLSEEERAAFSEENAKILSGKREE